MIKINSIEKWIFDLFWKFIKDEKMDITLRVAGGWVRDKLLGYESDDIDIAIDSLLGSQFCDIFVKYLDKNNI